ncbi:MAG: hypothetical protein ACREBG_30790 [Pyrinomonadaceae bacterium]
MKDVMGVDQYGTTYHALGKYPRQELLRRLDRKHAEIMYRDPDARRVGYVIGGRWIELFNVTPWGNE